jgi:tripartite-type tricarboxylate transporter receptor subunit TctC
MQEAGVSDFEVDSWYAMLVPARTPRPIIDRLNRALNTVLQEPAVRAQLIEQGAEAVGGTPEDLGRVIAAELPKWAKLAREAGIKAD